MSQTIRTTMRPDVEITVSDVEYAGLVRLGLVYGVAVPGPQDPSDGEVAAYVNEPGSAVTQALRAALVPQARRGLRSFRASYGSRDVQQLRVLGVGDSILEGTASSARSRRWFDRTLVNLRRGVKGGAGYIPASSHWSGWANPWTGTGTGSDDFGFGLGLRARQIAQGGTRSITVTGTSIDVHFVKGGGVGTFTVTVDGAGSPAATINANQAQIASAKQRVTLGSSGSHTVLITATSGLTIFEGVTVFDGDENAGVIGYEAGWFGQTSGGYLTNLTNATNHTDPYALTNPHLVLVELGTNVGAETPAQTAANITSIISTLRAVFTTKPSFVVMGAYNTNHSDWAARLDAMRGIAATDSNVEFFDLSRYLPSVADDDLGLINADVTHPTDLGEGFIAEALTSFLLAP